MPTPAPAATLEVENLSWPRFWVVDIHSEDGKETTTTTGKLLQQVPDKENLKLRYLCMCGNTFVRIMGNRQDELEEWVSIHRPHNKKMILDLIPERLRAKVVKEHPEQ